MRLCFFDDVAGGHHATYLSGLVSAAWDRGDHVVMASPEPIQGFDGQRGRWIRVPATRHRQVITGRRVLNRVIRLCASEQIDLFANLYLDKTIWTLPYTGFDVARTVHVLHHVHHYAHDPASTRRRVRIALARQLLRAWANRGDTIVVHTARALQIMADVLPEGSLRLLGYPIHPMPSTDPQPRESPVDETVELLFVGQARAEKGLAYLIQALHWLPDHVTVVVVGHQNPTVRAALIAGYGTARIRWVDRFVSDVELARYLDRATLTVLPYESGFGFRGGASGVLLDTLARGRPLVTTTSLAPQLPPSFDGAVVVPPEDPKALAEGITDALTHLPSMEAAARAAGPRFIRLHHSFEAYLDDLLLPDDR